jgi:hypothetical protein
MILKLIAILIQLETGNGVKDNGDAIGPLQIKPIFIEEVNRITGSCYKHSDARNKKVAMMIVHAYMRHQYNRFAKRHKKAPSVYEMALIFRYGPTGYLTKGWKDDYGMRAANMFFDKEVVLRKAQSYALSGNLYTITAFQRSTVNYHTVIKSFSKSYIKEGCSERISR